MTQKEARKEDLRVFLSYSVQDRERARGLIRTLSSRSDVRVFDSATLSAGEDWRSQLKEEILGCDVFLVLLSPDSLDSEFVMQEVGAAWAIEKPIIVALTDSATAYELPVPPDRVLALKELEKPEVISRVITDYERGLPGDLRH